MVRRTNSPTFALLRTIGNRHARSANTDGRWYPFIHRNLGILPSFEMECGHFNAVVYGQENCFAERRPGIEENPPAPRFVSRQNDRLDAERASRNPFNSPTSTLGGRYQTIKSTIPGSWILQHLNPVRRKCRYIDHF